MRYYDFRKKFSRFDGQRIFERYIGQYEKNSRAYRLHRAEEGIVFEKNEEMKSERKKKKKKRTEIYFQRGLNNVIFQLDIENSWSEMEKNLDTARVIGDLEKGVSRVTDWILGPADAMLNSCCQVGFDVSSSEELRRRHEELELECRVKSI